MTSYKEILKEKNIKRVTSALQELLEGETQPVLYAIVQEIYHRYFTGLPPDAKKLLAGLGWELDGPVIKPIPKEASVEAPPRDIKFKSPTVIPVPRGEMHHATPGSWVRPKKDSDGNRGD